MYYTFFNIAVYRLCAGDLAALQCFCTGIKFAFAYKRSEICASIRECPESNICEMEKEDNERIEDCKERDKAGDQPDQDNAEDQLDQDLTDDQTEQENIDDQYHQTEEDEMNFIQDYIERKKLQNRILKEIIENIKHTDKD